MARRGRMAFGDAAAPLWLTLNPHWPIEIAELSASTGLYILELLQAHGDRWTMVNHRRVWGIMSSNEEVFVEDQPEAEEGSATEYQVRIPHQSPFPVVVEPKEKAYLILIRIWMFVVFWWLS